LPHLKGSGASKDLDTVVVLIRLFKWVDIREKVISIMNNLSIITLSWDDRDNLIEVLDYVANNNVISEFNFSIKDFLIQLSENMTYYFQNANPSQSYTFASHTSRHTTKACKRVCLPNAEKKKLKISFPSKNFKNAITQSDTKTFGQLVANLNI
jgi:hypothetical protein